jgi:hypothetical protein
MLKGRFVFVFVQPLLIAHLFLRLPAVDTNNAKGIKAIQSGSD